MKKNFFAEHRLLRYNSFTGRTFGEVWNTYLDIPPDQNNPVDIARRVFAGAFHVATTGVESLIRDGVRKFEGNNAPVQPLSGDMPRLGEDMREIVPNLKEKRIGSAILNVTNAVGSLFTDVVDKFGGVDRNKGAHVGHTKM